MKDMKPKNIKSSEDWKDIIGALSAKDFEHLCYDLVSSMPGFTNVDLRDGGADGGRDIDSVYKSKMPDNRTEIFEKWRFECKKYSNGVPYDVISGKILQANANNIDKIVIMSNMHLTPSCKDEIDNTRSNFSCKIIDWTGKHFQDILFQYPDICKDYFPDEDIPQRFLDASNSQELITATQDASSHFGMELNFTKIDPNINNIDQVTTIIKERLLNLNIDLNIKSLIYQQVSRLFLSVNRKETALFFINESLKITPENIPALLNKAFILEDLEKLDESNKCYNIILKLDETNKYALNNKACILKEKGDFDNALKFVDNALKADPSATLAIANKSSILLEMGRNSDAANLLDSELDKHSNSKTILSAKVNLLIESKDFNSAMNLNNQIIQMDHDDTDLIHTKGVIYASNANYQDAEKYFPLAIECFDIVLSKDKGNSVVWSNKIKCLLSNELIDEAEDTINEALKFCQNDSNILSLKGAILLEKNKPKKALKFINKSLNRRYSNGRLKLKAYALLLLRRNIEVVDLMNRLLKYATHDPMAWLYKGLALQRLHQKTKANICFQRAKEYDTDPISFLE